MGESTSPEINEFLHELRCTDVGCGAVWLGVSDIVKEKDWVWESGSPVSWSNWAQGQPNGGRDQNCVYMDSRGDWFDTDCSVEWYYI